MAEPTIELVNRGVLPVTREMVFPVSFGSVETTHALSLRITLQGITVLKVQFISNLGPNKATLDIRDLPNGVYILKMTQGEQTQIRKVVIKR